MELHDASDAVMCRAFSLTLADVARLWFKQLKPQSISSFAELSEAFLTNFIGGKKKLKPPAHLNNIVQKEGELLKDYIKRFNFESLQVRKHSEETALNSLMQGVRDKPFLASLDKNPPMTLAEFMARSDKYADAEETRILREAAQNAKTSAKESAKKEVDSAGGKKRKDDRSRDERKPGKRPDRKFSTYAALNKPQEQVLMEIKNEGFINWPNKLRTNPNRRSKNKYCHYHRDHGHNTSDCIHLKEEIERLIREGRLTEHVERSGTAEVRPIDNQPIEEIRTIVGGHQGGGDSNNARKRHARNIHRPESELLTIARPSKEKKREKYCITFDDEDARGICHPHDDALVITLTIANRKVYRILVDTGSSADVLFSPAFNKMGIQRSALRSVRTPLVGFSGGQVLPEGVISLPLTAGNPPQQTTIMVDFLIVDQPSVYNAILGRPSLSLLQAVVSTFHLSMKFPTESGIGVVKGDQQDARQCYATAVKMPVENTAPEVLTIGSLDPRVGTHERGQPVEELISVPLIATDETKTVQIGSALRSPLKDNLISLLRRYADIFAWSHEDMPGINPSVITHRLNIDPAYRPVRQKRRPLGPERYAVIEEEVGKLLKARLIEEIYYPEWVANVVLVKKANGKWRVCVDYTDLNKACPKDSFPLPRIDQLVDSTAGHELLSFMDAYSGYNQIVMHESDKSKTTFVTDKGLYCYRVMPFGLKNAGATYQRLVNKIFARMIGRTMEVYIDDMLVKSIHAADHIADLEEMFLILRKFQMKLNPSKCAFGVGSGKFLGFLVSQRGIEANPEKIKALLDMESPKTIKEIQRLTGRIAALNRFLSRATDKCLPFFKQLKGQQAVNWTQECETAFQQLKTYLGSPPLLSKPEPGETLLLYLAVSEAAVSSALIREHEGKQLPVYYVSKALLPAETRYPLLEKVALVLIVSSRRLRPYFQAHSIAVMTDLPLRQILQKPEASGRLTKWAIELSEFDIQYRPRMAIKGQAVADFIAEVTPQTDTTITALVATPASSADPIPWKLFVDGSSNSKASGAGVVLETPDQTYMQYALRLGFQASNNTAEYEALLLGLRLAASLGVTHLDVFSDSQLVVNQVTNVYQTRKEQLKAYMQRAKELMAGFQKCIVTRIPRAENGKADLLAKLASANEDEIPRSIPIEYVPKPSVTEQIGPAVLPIESEPTWLDPIMNYLHNGDLPEDRTEARRLKIRASRYTVLNGILYKKGYYTPLLRCLNHSEADYVLREIHEGICGNHSGGRSLAHKVLRQGYYWPTIQNDARKLVQKCDKCQRFAIIPRQPPEELTPMTGPWPFAQWGIDIIGPLPIGKGQTRFAVVAVDYFTKWAEAEPLAKITEHKITEFVWKNIICRFGIPYTIITDNGKQFDNRGFREMCSNLGIRNVYSSPHHPQTNGQVEAVNKIIKQHLRTKLDRAKGAWAEELPKILWAYRTTVRTATGETPFSLAYGSEAVTPVEIGLPSARVSSFNEEENEELLNLGLEFIDERREMARLRMMVRQQQVARFYNARVRIRRFRVGDMVLRKTFPNTKEVGSGALGPNWEGPYIVSATMRPGTYRLEDLTGQLLPHPWNAEHLKIYYP